MKRIEEYEHGIHLAVPHNVYHARVRGMVSAGALAQISRTPAHYDAWLKAGDEPTEAKEFGGAFHCKLLEAERFEEDYVEIPDFGDMRFKENKALFAQWKAEHPDAESKQRVKAEDLVAMNEMVASVLRHPLASKMIHDGQSEVTVRWRDQETGLECRTRTDYYVARRRMAVDIKTTFDASESAFRKSVANYRYHVTDALYRAGFAAVGAPIDYYVFVVVEKTPPYAVAVYTLDADAIQRGFARATLDMQRLAECVRNDAFPGYPETIQTLALPPWAA